MDEQARRARRPAAQPGRPHRSGPARLPDRLHSTPRPDSCCAVPCLTPHALRLVRPRSTLHPSVAPNATPAVPHPWCGRPVDGAPGRSCLHRGLGIRAACVRRLEVRGLKHGWAVWRARGASSAFPLPKAGLPGGSPSPPPPHQSPPSCLPFALAGPTHPPGPSPDPSCTSAHARAPRPQDGQSGSPAWAEPSPGQYQIRAVMSYGGNPGVCFNVKGQGHSTYAQIGPVEAAFLVRLAPAASRTPPLALMSTRAGHHAPCRSICKCKDKRARVHTHTHTIHHARAFQACSPHFRACHPSPAHPSKLNVTKLNTPQLNFTLP